MALNLSGNEHAYPFIIGNTKLPYFLVPYYNPNRLDISSQKEYNRTQTIGGQVFEHWGKKPEVMHVEMTILKNDFLGGVVNIYKNATFKDTMFSSELDALKRLYEMDQRYIKKLSLAKVTNSLTEKSNELKPNKITGVGGTMDYLSSLAIGGAAVVTDSIDKAASWMTKFSDTIIYYKLNIYSGFFINFKVTEDGKEPFINKVSFDFLITHTIQDYLNQWLATADVGRAVSGILGGVSAATTLTSIIDSIGNGLTDTVKNQISGIKNG